MGVEVEGSITGGTKQYWGVVYKGKSYSVEASYIPKDPSKEQKKQRINTSNKLHHQLLSLACLPGQNKFRISSSCSFIMSTVAISAAA